MQSGEKISSSVAIPNHTSDVSTVPVSLPSTFLIISEEVLHAEFLWVIKVIISHYPFSFAKLLAVYFLKCFQTDCTVIFTWSYKVCLFSMIWHLSLFS